MTVDEQKANAKEKKKLVNAILKGLKFKAKFSDFESKILNKRMTPAWFKKLVDVTEDGSSYQCLSMCSHGFKFGCYVKTYS